MNKFLIFASILGAAGAGAYLIQTTTPETAANQQSVAAYAPDDTVFYSGTVEPFDLRQGFGWMQGVDMSAQVEAMEAMINTSNNQPPALNVLGQLYVDYLKHASNFETLTKTFGIGDKLNAASYTVGAVPVLRYQADDPKAVETLVLNIEKRIGYSAAPKTIDNITYRGYPFGEGDAAGADYELIIGHHGDHVVFTINTPLADETDLHPALGAVKPSRSLAQTGTLNDIIDEYGFNASYVGLIDHTAIIQGLTSPEANNFGQSVKQLLALNNAGEVLSAFQSEGCRKDLTALAQGWPRTVSGYTELNDKKMVMVTTVESNLTQTMTALQKLRGAIPASYRQQPAMFAMALGLNLDELPAFLNKAWADFVGQQYQCPLLVDAQNQLKQNNPAMLSMATAMVQSVKGVAVALLDMQFAEGPSGPMPDPQKTSVALTITADNPQSLLMMAATFVPELGGLQLEDNGKPQTLAIPGSPVPINIAMQGQQLTLFTGAGADAYLPKNAQSAANVEQGFLYFGIDYSKYFGLMEQALKMAPLAAQEHDIKTLESLKGLAMNVAMTTDFSDKGIVFEVIGQK